MRFTVLDSNIQVRNPKIVRLLNDRISKTVLISEVSFVVCGPIGKIKYFNVE